MSDSVVSPFDPSSKKSEPIVSPFDNSVFSDLYCSRRIVFSKRNHIIDMFTITAYIYAHQCVPMISLCSPNIVRPRVTCRCEHKSLAGCRHHLPPIHCPTPQRGQADEDSDDEEAEDDGPLPLTLENVERVLDKMRPYLMSDGGNVKVAQLPWRPLSPPLTHLLPALPRLPPPFPRPPPEG
jgi:hypothetical protein